MRPSTIAGMFCKAEENKKKRVYSSAHAPEEWSKLYGKPQYELGVWSIVFSTVCQVSYRLWKWFTYRFLNSRYHQVVVLFADSLHPGASRVLSWAQADVLQGLSYSKMIAIFGKLRTNSLQIMLFVALADVGALSCFGTLFGYTMIRGMVFCSDWKLAWFVGSGEVCEY